MGSGSSTGALRDAADSGNTDQVRELIASGVDINAKQTGMWAYGNTALHKACRQGNVESARLLLDAGAIINVTNSYGNTPLIYACREGTFECAELLLARRANPNVVAEYKHTPLSLAREAKRLDLVKLLVDNKANMDVVVRGDTSLTYACSISHVGMAKLLVEKGADAHAKDAVGDSSLHLAVRKDALKPLVADMIAKSGGGGKLDVAAGDGDAPLHTVSRTGDSELAALLMSKGASIRVENREKDTPLHIVCREGNASMAKLLVEKGADAHAKNAAGYTSLYLAISEAAFEDPVDLVKDMIAKSGGGGKLDVTLGARQDAMLHIASRTGDSTLAALLLGAGADVNVENRDKDTSLHISCRRNDAEIAKLLIDNGANVSLPNQHQDTPLHITCQSGYSNITKLLIDGGANVDAIDPRRDSPLHHACRKCHVEDAKLLLDGGAKTNEWNEEGETPLIIARYVGCAEIVTLMTLCKQSLERVFYFVPRAVVLACTDLTLPRMQVLRDAGSLVKLTVDLANAFTVGVTDKVFVSHRWEEMEAPDSQGKQIAEVQSYLQRHPEVEYVWCKRAELLKPFC